VTEVAQANGFSSPAWSPDGRHFAVTWGWGMSSPGETDIYTADGQRMQRIPEGQEVAWLDASTLALLDSTMATVNGSVILHSISGGTGSVEASASIGIVGSGTSRLAVASPIDSDPATADAPSFRVFGDRAGSAPGDAAWSIATEFEGQPIAWSNDGTLLAIHVDPGAATATEAGVATAAWRLGSGDRGPTLGAGGQVPTRLVVRRFPGGQVVPTPDVVFDARADWLFSPGRRYLAGGSVFQETSVIDLAADRLINVPYAHAGWTGSGQLVLVQDNGPALLWAPDGSITPTDLPVGTPTFGPVSGEIFINPPFNPGVQESAIVRIGDRTASIPLPLYAPGATASWAPDGSACYVATASDDAQLLDARLYRVSIP
jgi:hypothetical protein